MSYIGLQEADEDNSGVQIGKKQDILIYHNKDVMLRFEHPITLGLLKRICLSEENVVDNVIGVKTKDNHDKNSITTVILNDERLLDDSNYELIFEAPPTNNQEKSAMDRDLASANWSKTERENTTEYSAKKRNFTCEFCHLPFASKSKFEKHKRIHTEEKPFTCIYCGELFAHHAELRRHRDEQHMPNKSFKCTSCSKSFSTRTELKGHSWRHTGEKTYKCDICGKTYSTKGNLKLHIEKHAGLKSHECTLCPLAFSSHSVLESHMRKHTGVKPYKCRHCSVMFATAGLLTAHERIHTGERPYKCVVCGKAFRLNSARVRHEQRHETSRKYACDICARHFSQAKELAWHMNTHKHESGRLVPCPSCKTEVLADASLSKHADVGLTERRGKALSESLGSEEDGEDILGAKGDQQLSKLSQKLTITCEYCNFSAFDFPSLVQHISRAHLKRDLTDIELAELKERLHAKSRLTCELCAREFSSHASLRRHIIAQHSEEEGMMGILPGKDDESVDTFTEPDSFGLTECRICSRSFIGSKGLKTHLYAVHGIKAIPREPDTYNAAINSFKCRFCPRVYFTPTDAVLHMTTDHDNLDGFSYGASSGISLNTSDHHQDNAAVFSSCNASLGQSSSSSRFHEPLSQDSGRIRKHLSEKQMQTRRENSLPKEDDEFEESDDSSVCRHDPIFYQLQDKRQTPSACQYKNWATNTITNLSDNESPEASENRPLRQLTRICEALVPEFAPHPKDAFQFQNPVSSTGISGTQPTILYASSKYFLPSSESLKQATASQSSMTSMHSANPMPVDFDKSENSCAKSETEGNFVNGPSPFISAIESLSKKIGSDYLQTNDPSQSELDSAHFCQEKLPKVSRIGSTAATPVASKKSVCDTTLNNGSLTSSFTRTSLGNQTSKGKFLHETLKEKQLQSINSPRESPCNKTMPLTVDNLPTAELDSKLETGISKVNMPTIAPKFVATSQKHSSSATSAVHSASSLNACIDDASIVHVPPIMQTKAPPPVGFKIGYKLAYVPVFVPDEKNQASESIVFDWMKKKKRSTNPK